MSKYTEIIQEIFKNANSKKIMDKRKFVTELLELYNNEAAVKEICKNTEQNVQDAITWSYIIHAVHKIVLNEAERLAIKGNCSKAVSNEWQNTCALVRKTVHHANNHEVPLLKCMDLMPLIFQILQTKIYEFYHDAYLGILVSYILPFRIYRINMLPDQWKELLKICVALYKSGSLRVNKRTILDALQMIVEYGCLYSDLLLDVKKLLPFLEKIFIDVKGNSELLPESACKLANTICQHIAIECRTALCKFSEDILPNVISINSFEEKYKLLLLFVQIHHPNGISTAYDGAYSNDWTKWNDILKSLYLMILRDCKPDILSKNFIHLATEVFKQVLEKPDFILDARSFNECDYLQPAKRRKIATKISGPIDMIIDNCPEEAWPIIQILTFLLKKYPNCLKPRDFSEFLKILVDFLTQSCKEETIMDNLYELITVLLKNEELLSVDVEACNLHWDKIWDILLRSLNMNQNEISGYTLAQLFIKKKKVINPCAFLRLYLTNVIKWSPMSVRTLVVFCQCVPLPTEVSMFNISACSPITNTDSVRLSLLKWTLDIPWQKMSMRILVNELCSLLIGITLKSWCAEELIFNDEVINTCHCSQKIESSESVPVEHIQYCYLSLMHKINVFATEKEENLKQSQTQLNDNVLFIQDLLTYLINNLCIVSNETNESDDLCIIIVKVTILAKVATLAKQLNMICGDIEKCPMICTMKKYLENAYGLLAKIDPSRSKYAHLFNITKVLNVLYETPYDTDIAKIIVSFSTLDLLKNIFNLMNIEDRDISDYQATNDYYDYNAFQGKRKRSDRDVLYKRCCSFCNDGIIRTRAAKALSLFCCMDVGSKKLDIQVRLMKKLLSIEMYDVSHKVDFKMAMIVLEILLKYNQEELSRNCKEMPIKVLSELYQKCYKDEAAVRYILNVLPYFYDYAIKYNYETEDLLNIFTRFHVRLSQKKYGFLAHKKYIECLSKVIQLNASASSCGLYSTSKQITTVVENISLSLNDPLYVIRFEAIQCIKEIYSLNSIDLNSKETFYDQIEEAVNKLFVINRSLEENEKPDEKETRLSSALLALSAIIYTNGTLQCRALLAMLHLTVDKQVESQAIKKLLQTMDDKVCYITFIEENLNYLLSNWLNSKYSSEPFPWILTNCETQEQFTKTYINMLLSIKFQNLDLIEAINLCNYINLPFAEAIENVFPYLLSWLLHCICGKEESATKKIASKILHKLLSNSDEFVNVKRFSCLFDEKFGEILTYFIQRLHDEDYLEQTLELHISLPKSDPPHFKKETVDICFQYIEKNFFTQGKSIQYILTCQCPNVLQRILMYLTNSIYKKQFLEHKLKALHQYTYFCTFVIQDLEEDYFDSLSTYLVRDIGYNILHLIKSDEVLLSEAACRYFNIFLRHILSARSEEAKEILNFAVTTLNSIVLARESPVALEILKFIIIDQKDVLTDAIKTLNSFPNTSVFKEIRAVYNTLKYETEKNCNLEMEIAHFLTALNDKSVNCTVEDISYLRLQLSTRKEELREMYKKLEVLHGFAEECASSILHQLIYRLIKLTASSDKNVSIEAAKCLGELGPADLTTMILYLGKSHVRENSEITGILSYKITALMTDFLLQYDVKLREASAEALYVVLSSHWGQKLLDTKYVKHIENVLGESERTLHLSYIQPFISEQSSKIKHLSLNNIKIANIINPNNVIWTTKSDGSYSEWITETTCKIAECFEGFYTESLIQVCLLSVNFCELILPRIIFLIIHTNKNLVNDISTCIDEFFRYHFNTASDTSIALHVVQTTKNCNHQTVHCMLNIVNYIRIQLTDIIPLRLNYMYIAKAAQYCSAYFTAILYAEMYCENMLSNNYKFASVPKIDYICEFEPEHGKVIQNILRDTYLKIGDPDAIYGSGSSHLQDPSTRIQHYIHTCKWDKVILAQDVELSSGNTTVIREMANGLHQSGLQYLLGHFISTMIKSDKKVDEDVQYECAWRLSNWNFCETNHVLYAQYNHNVKSEITENDYHYYHYQALKYFHESNEIGVRNAIENARLSIIKALKNISLESSKTVYEKLMQLQLILEIEELSSVKQDEYMTVLQKWQQHDITKSNEFLYVEPILTQRTVMYQITDAFINDVNIKDALATTYLEIAKIAANQDNLHIATRSLAALMKQKDLSTKIQDQLLYQESVLAWHRNDLEIGRFLLRSLLHKESLNPILRAQVLQVYGDWMAETKSENPQAVIKNYYLESINISTSIEEGDTEVIKNLHHTQVALARFADAQFEQISSYMKSPQFESLKECVSYSRNGIDMDPTSKDQDVRRAVIINQRQNSNDTAELEHIHNEKDNYLLLALKYYLRTLQQSEDYNLLIFRVIALWLDNRNHKSVNKILCTNLSKIPSFKFIPLVPQIAAHMSNVNDEFSIEIYKIMERCALEHPHHTLPVLLSLKNLYGDREYDVHKKNKKVKEEARILGARKLLEYLTNSNVGCIVNEMNKLSHALLMLAYLETATNKSNRPTSIPKSQAILKVKNFQNLVIPTLTIYVKPSGNYSNVIGIFKYLETYESVGGNNAPKKVVCVGTDGIQRHQLVKGKDDLRQDAVMQQVFNVMNILLKACKEAKRRKLLIRTYKVVPLTQRSGILEWCDNTIPIVSALVGSTSAPGLHKKYYPKDYTANVCREKMAAVSKSSNELKLKAFMDCCLHMHPAFHHFFTENYPAPETWFERRSAYTRSVATTCIAGYILGLGDRHLNNILIDRITGEVIHIDFGIAFEQGKVLPIPETVPFRLTRNIEAAMGVSGIEGTMRRCCETTLTVLRDQRQIIITLLQVLLYDPLFTWAITPDKAHKIQSGNSSKSTAIGTGVAETNKTAERALLRIEQKLQGSEEGLASSISGQVERLIQEARDPSNLCRLYCGWQPYL